MFEHIGILICTYLCWRGGRMYEYYTKKKELYDEIHKEYDNIKKEWDNVGKANDRAHEALADAKNEWKLAREEILKANNAWRSARKVINEIVDAKKRFEETGVFDPNLEFLTTGTTDVPPPDGELN